MKLGEMCRDAFKEVKKRQKERRKKVRKAMEIEMAWRRYEKDMGVRPGMSLEDAVNRTLGQIS